MIPFIRVPDFHIGPMPLHPFGILVATGVLLGTSVTARRAERRGYDVVKLNSFITWMLVSAFVLSHALDAVFYHWRDEVLRLPWSVNPLADAMPWYIVKPWLGLSSFGGFIGALVGILLWKYLEVTDGKLRLRANPAPILAFGPTWSSRCCRWVGCPRAGRVHDRARPHRRAGLGRHLLAVAWPSHTGDGEVTRIGLHRGSNVRC